MPITDNVGGVLHELDTIHSNVGGVLHELDTVHSNDGGVLHEIHSAWEPPDTLTWYNGYGEPVSASNNGYNCTFDRGSGAANTQVVEFTLVKPTRFTITLDNWTGLSDSYIYFMGYTLDGGSAVAIPNSDKSFSVDITDEGSHSIIIKTFGAILIFSVTAEKI